VTLAISLASLAVSLVALVWSQIGARRSLLRELHNDFISPERALQRHALHDAYRKHGAGWPDLVTDAEKAQINLGLAHLDHLAFHAVRGYVTRRDARTLWARAIHECRERGAAWIQHRRRTEVEELWVFLDRFCRDFPDPRQGA